MRTSTALLASLLLACSSDDAPQVHGTTIKPDAGSTPDATVLPDVSVPVDAVADQVVKDVVTTDAPSCPGTTVLLAGSSSALYGGSATNNASIVVSAVAGNAIDRIAITPSGTGFLAALRSSGNAVTSTIYTGSWADTAAIPAITTIGAPALATLGNTAHLVYQDANFKYEHGTWVGSAWTSTADPVGGAGNSQSFGAKPTATAGAGTDLVVLLAGSDGLLYDQTYSAATWKPAHQQAMMSVENTVSPSIVTLSTGDLLGVYMRKGDFKIMSTVRVNGTWAATPLLIDPNAFANDPVALSPLPNGRALMVYRGSDTVPYFSVYDSTKTPAWTAPVAVLASKPTIASTPSVSPGVCGDEAVVAYAKLGGGVELAHFAGGAFTGPDTVSGTTGATYAAVATKP